MRASVTIGAVLASLAAIPATAQAPSEPRQTASGELTTTRPGSPTGSSLDIEIRNPANPEGKPHTVTRIVFRLAAGTKIDTSVPVRCTASDEELLAMGPDACPPESLVNQGKIVTDTGSDGGALPRFIENDVKNFNADGELLGVATSTNAPLIPGVTRVVTHSKISDGTITFVLPGPFPGTGPPDDYSALRSLHVSGPAIVRNGRAYALTPPTCPATGRWSGSFSFDYIDGVTQTVNTGVPCQPTGSGGAAGLMLRLTGRRSRERSCFARSVRATVTGQASSPALRAEFFVGSRRVARDRSRPLSRRIDRRRRGGRARSRLARANVRLSDGRLETLARRYRVCAGSG